MSAAVRSAASSRWCLAGRLRAPDQLGDLTIIEGCEICIPGHGDRRNKRRGMQEGTRGRFISSWDLPTKERRILISNDFPNPDSPTRIPNSSYRLSIPIATLMLSMDRCVGLTKLYPLRALSVRLSRSHRYSAAHRGPAPRTYLRRTRGYTCCNPTFSGYKGCMFRGLRVKPRYDARRGGVPHVVVARGRPVPRGGGEQPVMRRDPRRGTRSPAASVACVRADEPAEGVTLP